MRVATFMVKIAYSVGKGEGELTVDEVKQALADYFEDTSSEVSKREDKEV